MLTSIVKFVSIAALLLTTMLWTYAPSFDIALRFVVGFSALVVATQAIRARKRYWAVAFYVIAFLFNPFAAVITLTGTASMLVILATVVPFAISLSALKPQRLLSIPSITDRTPGSESL